MTLIIAFLMAQSITQFGTQVDDSIALVYYVTQNPKEDYHAL